MRCECLERMSERPSASWRPRCNRKEGGGRAEERQEKKEVGHSAEQGAPARRERERIEPTAYGSDVVEDLLLLECIKHGGPERSRKSQQEKGRG